MIPKKAYLFYALAVLFLAYEMALQVSPSVMTHELMRDFAIGAGTLGVMASFYFYSYTLMQIPTGILFDIFSPRSLLTFSIAVCSLGALFFGISDSVGIASLGRFLMGIGSAFAFIGVLVVASQWFPRRAFALLVGIAQLLAALGALGGELPLAAAVNAAGWRSVITVLGYAGLGLCVLVFLFMRGHPDHHRELHPSARFFESDFGLVFRNPQTYWVALYAFSGWAPVAVFAALWGVPFLMHKYDVSNTTAALATSMVWLGIALIAPIIGYLSDLMKKRLIPITTCAIVGLVSTLIVIYVDSLPFYWNFPLLFLMGFASSGQILSFAIVQDINKPSIVGTAIGVNNMAVVIGGALFQPLAGWILGIYWQGDMRNNIPLYSLDGYKVALAIVPVCYAIGLLTSLFSIEETNCEPHYPGHGQDLNSKG